MNQDQLLRQQLVKFLDWHEGHADFRAAVDDFPAELRGTVPEGLPYSAWQLLEHLRITQRDILDFIAPPTGGYQPMEWPADYWPKSAEPSGAHAWDECVKAVHSDRQKFEALLRKPDV